MVLVLRLHRLRGQGGSGDENDPFSVVYCGRSKSADVDVKTFMRFPETENGGFRKRTSVDGA